MAAHSCGRWSKARYLAVGCVSVLAAMCSVQLLPRKRSDLPIVCCNIAAIIIMSVHYSITSTNIMFFMVQYVIGFLLTVLSELLLRIFLLIEEKQHLISRYENYNRKDLIADVFKVNPKVHMALAVCAIYLVYFLTAFGWKLDAAASEILVCVMPTMYLFIFVLELDSGPIYNSYWIEKDNGLDYGSSMAYSFYHGYLKFILPKSGMEDKNIEELITDYENENMVTFGTQKMFILIPKSLKYPVNLGDAVKHRKHLREKIISVAGVRDRAYKNAIYSIKCTRNKSLYVCADTPLISFKDVLSSNGYLNGYHRRHKNDILLQFYLALAKILKHNQLDSRCEMIYYEDLDDEGRPRDVGLILLSRIKQQYKKEKNNVNSKG